MYETVNEIFKAAADLSDELALTGHAAASDEIRGTLRTFWTTSTEALGEMRVSLSKVVVLADGETLRDDLRDRIAALQRACTTLMNLG